MKIVAPSFLQKTIAAGALASGLMVSPAPAQQVNTVFYILLENRNFTAADDLTGGSVIAGNSAAPYLNSLITPNSGNSAQVSYCTAYHHVLSTPSGNNPSIHPSEPNYIWMESGNNLGKADDNDPYGDGGTVQEISDYLAANPSLSPEHFTGLLQAANISWKSYQEDIDHLTSTGTNANLGGTLTSTVAPQSLWTVPLVSLSGSDPGYVNPYNGSNQWAFACKHDGSLFYPDTNGGTVAAGDYSTSNPEVPHYAPLEQLAADLTNNTVARFNVITPDLYNDMHTPLPNGFTYQGTLYTGDLAQVAQGDNFLSRIVPQIMASAAYKNNGAIVIWTDETEGTNRDDFTHTLTEIVISPLAKGNAYAANLNYTHSSDIVTLQRIFQVAANTSSGYLNDAANPSNSSGAQAGTAPGFGTGTAMDMSDLLQDGAVPSAVQPPFFNGATALTNGVYYLSLTGGSPFGYFSFLTDPHYIYHFDLGYEYVFDAADSNSGVYLYDFTSGDFFYTSPAFPFPYLYDFALNTVLYYYPDPSNPGHYNTKGVRYFYDFATGAIITK